MKLVIVESPNKKTTIQKYLGSDYKVEASVGHVIDLATTGKYNLGVDIDSGNFEPTWAILPGKEKVVSKLTKLAESADEIYFASDPDREGEAIAWHLCKLLNKDPLEAKRLEFHEITKHAILDSFENIRPIDINLYNAQETRRIMDRIIGFRLSFLLFRDIKCPSAGRVQSVVLKFLYDNNEAISSFIPVNYYHVKAYIKDDNNDTIELNLVDENNQIIRFNTLEEAQKSIENIGTFLTLESINEEEKTVSSFPPYTMSKLMQAASSLHHYSTKKTTQALKLLFEAGYITYPRTDSIRIAPEFINKTKAHIKESFGESYVGVAKVQGKKDGVADAHEALRPTDLSVSGDDIAAAFPGVVSTLTKNIYELIYKQTIMSMMAAQVKKETTYTYTAGGNKFSFTNTHIIFDGWTKLSNKENKEYSISSNINDQIEIIKTDVIELQTKPEPYYTEGTLVKKMEETGIGRPSTYNTTIQTLLANGYIKTEKYHLIITDQGIKACKYLISHFPQTIKTEYTAELEEQLDQIANNTMQKLDVLTVCNNNFLDEFDYMIKNPDPVGPSETGELCPICGKPLVKITTKNHSFIGCSDYPACRYIKPEYTGKNCPDCGKPLVYKQGKFGKFIACSGYPECKHVEYPKKTFYKKK